MKSVKELTECLRRADELSLKKINRDAIMELMDELGKCLVNEGCYIQNYNDIKMYDEIRSYIPAYSLSFIQEQFIPFLEEHSPKTVMVLDMVVSFYSLVLYELILDDKFLEKIQTDNLTEFMKKNGICLFDFCWELLTEIMNLGFNTENRIIYPFLCEFYVEDALYRLMEQKIINNYYGSWFETVLNRVLGIYRIRFSCVNYIKEVQPMFLRVAGNYRRYM